jgi:transcriptional regulator with XRE-family HTH domain
LSVGENLRRIRKERGLGQIALGKASGVGQPTISGIERGRRDPHQSTLERLADALGVTVADFYAEGPAPKGPPPPPRTPRTDEAEAAFVARFDRADEAEAGALRQQLDGELTTLQRYVRQLRTLGVEDEDFSLRRALGKLSRCVRRLRAVTLLWTDLGLGRPRKPFQEYADPVDALESWLREIEREEVQQRRLFNNGIEAS